MDASLMTDFTNSLMPLTFFRRRAGEALEKLGEEGILILTKDGKPIAKITPMEEKTTEIDFEKIAKKYFGAIPDLTMPKRYFRKRNIKL